MIKSFKDKNTAKVFQGIAVPVYPNTILQRAFVKLQLIDVAGCINDLRIPPSNRLEALSGDRKGQHSIRINDKYRICFCWRDNNAYDVEIVDYH